MEPVPSGALRRISDREGAITLDDHLGGEVAVGVAALILQLLGGRGGLVGAAGLLLLLGVLAVALGKATPAAPPLETQELLPSTLSPAIEAR